MEASFYSRDELAKLGLKSYGENVLISRFARLYNPELLSIGNHVRIDDFCILGGTITLGSYIHIAPYCLLQGKAGITMEDFSGLSSRCSLYTESEDYVLGTSLTNPMVPREFRNVEHAPIVVKKHALLGVGTVILPGSVIETGCTFGAQSLLQGKTEPWTVYRGNPVMAVCLRRSKRILELEKELEKV